MAANDTAKIYGLQSGGSTIAPASASFSGFLISGGSGGGGGGSSQWTTTGSDIYYNTGNVGIGTTSPGLAGGNKELTVSAGTSGTVYASLNLQGNSASSNNGIANIGAWNGADRIALINFRRSTAANDGHMTFITASGGTLSERMRIDSNGGVSIGSAADAASSALLDLTSTTKGFLPPRMTGAQITAISSPATGLVVYNTDTNSLQLYNGTGWLSFGSNQTGNTMVSGWPDAIRCIRTSDSAGVVMYASFSPLSSLVRYRAIVNNGGDYVLDFNSNGTWNTTTLTASNCDNKTIAQLYTSGQAYNFVGGSTAQAAGSAGQVQFNSGGNLAADAGLTWDNTNKRLGIGTATPGYDLSVSKATGSGGNVAIQAQNTDNTTATSNAIVQARAGGSSGGDPYLSLDIAGEAGYSFGIDNSDSNKIKLTNTSAGPSGGTALMAIDASGNVGIGTAAPNVKLDVAGAIVSRGSDAGAGTSIDFSASNVAYTTAACGSFTLSNMQDGGTYSLIVKGSGTGPASFTHTGLTVKAPPSGLACTSGKHTVFSFIRAGTDVYVTMITGY
jgi:hypothetical protein